jgi:hypothetical protein
MSAITYTAGQLNAIINAGAVAYFNNINLGVLAPDSFSISVVGATETFGSSGTGDNGAIGVVNDGNHGVITMTLRGISKHILKAISGYRFVAGSTATNISTPFVGAIVGQSSPSVERGLPLVVRPITYDNTGAVEQADDTSNKLSFLFPKAVLTSDIEIPFSTSEVTDIELEFTCLVDATQTPPAFMYWDDGITSTGTYTP